MLFTTTMAFRKEMLVPIPILYAGKLKPADLGVREITWGYRVRTSSIDFHLAVSTSRIQSSTRWRASPERSNKGARICFPTRIILGSQKIEEILSWFPTWEQGFIRKKNPAEAGLFFFAGDWAPAYAGVTT